MSFPTQSGQCELRRHGRDEMNVIRHTTDRVDDESQFLGLSVQGTMQHVDVRGINDGSALVGCPDQMVVQSPVRHATERLGKRETRNAPH